MGFFFKRRAALGMTVAALAGGLFFQACVGDEPAVATDTTDGGTNSDATETTDAPSNSDDGGGDGSTTTTYTASVADDTKWEKFDIAPVASGPFQGGAFDGRYVYYIPISASSAYHVLVRYDTHAPFGSVTSWDANDLTGFGVNFVGALFAAPYLYLIPTSGTPADGTLVRYDTRGDFKSAASYVAFDVKTHINANDDVFGPGAYDGKYGYLGPAGGTNTLRFDTTQPFDAGATYQSFTFSAQAYYSSACFDGAHVYYVPFDAPQSSGPPLALGALKQYTTSGGFTMSSSFATFDLSPDGGGGVDPKANAFVGCVFDGRFLYLEPYGFGASLGVASLTVRYDTKASFTDVSSYAKYDLKNVNANAKGFHGGTFDGRYVYFAPLPGSTVVRFDSTAGSLANQAAWEPYDLTTSLSGAAHGYSGAVFDGRYVYLVPNNTTLAIRFDAKSPASLPPFSSSFY